MFDMKQDNALFYTKEESAARLSFVAVPLLDQEEIGANTYNKMRSGVNRRFNYIDEIEGMSVYDVTNVKDTEYRNANKIRYTIHLEQKLPDQSCDRSVRKASYCSAGTSLTFAAP